MAIVTISRGTFAGGEKLAANLSGRLGYRSISREVLYEHVRRGYGITQDELVQIMTWTPTRFDKGPDRRRRLFVSIQASLCTLLRDDDVVYHGQAGHLLLPEISHVVRVRLIAPRAKRIQMAMDSEGISSHQASCKIDQVDSERARWTEFVFGANWADPTLYDVVLNLERVDLEQAAELVCATVKLPAFRTSAESQGRLEDLALKSAVLAELLANPSTADLELKVETSAGEVSISGLNDRRLLDRVIEVARGVPGVAGVREA